MYVDESRMPSVSFLRLITIYTRQCTKADSTEDREFASLRVWGVLRDKVSVLEWFATKDGYHLRRHYGA